MSSRWIDVRARSGLEARAESLWHGVSTGMSSSEFRAWRQWMLINEPTTYFAWARVLARQEVKR